MAYNGFGNVRYNGVNLSDIEIFKESEIEEIELIDSGSFGNVIRGLLKHNNEEIAIKKLKNVKIYDFERSINENLLQEISILQLIKENIFCENIIRFYGICVDSENNVSIITKYYSQGTLASVLERKQLNIKEILHISKGIANGLNELHKNTPSIIHKDLKPENILLDYNYDPVIVDFGFSETINKNFQRGIRDSVIKYTPLYASPELLLNQTYSTPCDIYAFSLIIWQLLTGIKPYNEYSDFNNFRRAIIIDKIRPSLENLGFTPDINLCFERLLTAMWQPKSPKRINCATIYKILSAIEQQIFSRKQYE